MIKQHIDIKTRHIEPIIEELVRHFKIVLVLGARQTGKTTLLKKAFSDWPLITFDPVQDLYNVRQDPDLFLSEHLQPTILDEVQYVPELLAALKRVVDERPSMGQYILTGSQQFSGIRSIAESLAGRVAIVHLDPMTPYERYDVASSHWLSSYLERPDALMDALTPTQFLPISSLAASLWRGGYPGTLKLPDRMIPRFFSSYVETYIERDIRTLRAIGDQQQCTRFLGLVAAQTAQELNRVHLGRELGIATKTAQGWLDAFQQSFIAFTLPAYSGNCLKRVSQKEKLYLTDTGLACHLQHIRSAEALLSHPLLGALFETACVHMLYGLRETFIAPPVFYHWRSHNGAEVDLVVHDGERLYPIEMKCKAQLSKHDASGIHAFQETYPDQAVQPGIVIYAGTTLYRLTPSVIAVPWHCVLPERR